MKRSHIGQAHSTTYHPQTNGLVERQNRTLVNMLRVYCSRYMTDWDKYLPQVVGAYSSPQHSTTGTSPFMMLTGRERAMPLTFIYPEYEGKKTSPQANVKEAIKRQQELNELCRRNTVSSGPIRLGFPECYTFQGDEKTTQELARAIHDHGSTPTRKVLPLEYGRAARSLMFHLRRTGAYRRIWRD